MTDSNIVLLLGNILLRNALVDFCLAMFSEIPPCQTGLFLRDLYKLGPWSPFKCFKFSTDPTPDRGPQPAKRNNRTILCYLISYLGFGGMAVSH